MRRVTFSGASSRGGPPRGGNRRAGFTLVEMLVVIGILLLIAAITLGAVNLSFSGDRVRGAARQVQSYLEGARSRAIYGGNAATQGAAYQCGVRFIRDANNPNLVTSMQYVEIDAERGALTAGRFGIAYDTTSGLATRLIGTLNSPNESENTHWFERAQQGLIYDNQIIMLSNRRYQILTTNLTSSNEELILQTPYAGTLIYTIAQNFQVPPDPNIYAVPHGRQPPYKLFLAPQPMANQDPRLLGNGVVLDLTLSKGLAYYTSNGLLIDVMFSPRGTIVGPLAGTGIVEFAISDREDSLKAAPLAWTNWQPSTSYPNGSVVVATSGDAKFTYRCTTAGTSGSTEPTWVQTLGSTTSDSGATWTCVGAPKHDRLIVSLTPQTGKTAVHPIYQNPSAVFADPYRYAETGEVARQ